MYDRSYASRKDASLYGLAVLLDAEVVEPGDAAAQ